MKTSAGILMYRMVDGDLQVLLGHMGGPLWAQKDHGAWSIPKGECEGDEDPLEAAKREFHEEIGLMPEGTLRELTVENQTGKKRLCIWALEGTWDTGCLKSCTFTMEWPPKSGKRAAFPEFDRAQWFSISVARQKIVPSQAAFIDALAAMNDQRDTERR